MKHNKTNTKNKYFRSIPDGRRFQVVVLVVTILLGVSAYLGLSIYTEKNNIGFGEQRLGYVKAHIKDVAGSNTVTKDASYCTHSGQQNDYASGNRYCGKAMYGTYVSPGLDTAETIHSNIFNLLSRSQAFGAASVASSPGDRTYTFSGEQLSCTVIFSDSNPSPISANNPVERPYTVAYVISCDRPATFQYYPEQVPYDLAIPLLHKK